jgi:hypothetical protein
MSNFSQKSYLSLCLSKWYIGLSQFTHALVKMTQNIFLLSILSIVLLSWLSKIAHK